MKLEICANSFQSAINAENGGASQIELCSQLSIGGITPSYGLIQKVMDALNIPVNVLIRPRGGNFCYSEDEFEIIKKDIKICKDLGCAGIVTGILTEGNHLDEERTNKLVQLARPLTFTFHRAFDLIEQPFNALDELINMKVNFLLTSGQSKSALLGLDLLKDLMIHAANNIIIMPGGGIKSENARDFKRAGFEIIHASASKKTENNNFNGNQTSFFGDYSESISNIDEIKSMVANIEG